VEHIRTILAEIPGQVETQAFVRILGNAPRANAAGQIRLRIRFRDICDQVVILVQTGELVKKITDVDFIACQVTPDRMRVN